ncbi:MAG: spore germination protein GerW family protein [Acidimicrobiia bacterium]|nr:spore germination protein GerW family protein [Acidimicrobiia bacterium]
MSEQIDVSTMMETAKDALSVRRVFGDPIAHNGIQVIPAARVRGGGGSGGGPQASPDPDGAGAGTSSGGGFGLVASPAGVYVVDGNEVRWRPAVNTERIVLSGMALAAFALWMLRSILRD